MENKQQTRLTAEVDKQELFIERIFDAPRELVFEAFSNPAWIAQWLVPTKDHMRIDYANYLTGGAYRYIMPDLQGKEVGLFGIFHEVQAPERIIRTFEWGGLPEKGHAALEKTIFEALGSDQTKVRIQFICESVGFRDGLVQSGMEPRYNECYKNLDTLLEKVK